MRRITLLLFILGLTTTVHAQFLRGPYTEPFVEAGVGAGILSFEMRSTGSDLLFPITTPRDTKAGLILSLKAGVEYDATAKFYAISRTMLINLEGTLTTNGIHGVGTDLYFEDYRPSGYLGGALGVMNWTSVDTDVVETWWGFGGALQGGFAMSDVWLVDGSITWGKPLYRTDIAGVQRRYLIDALSITLTFSRNLSF